MKTISFGKELKRMGYEYEVNMEDHSGCWGKPCEGEHLEPLLTVWRKGEERFKRSFRNPEADWVLASLTREPNLRPAYV